MHLYKSEIYNKKCSDGQSEVIEWREVRVYQAIENDVANNIEAGRCQDGKTQCCLAHFRSFFLSLARSLASLVG